MKTMFETWSTPALIEFARETRIDGNGQRGLLMGGPPSGIDGLHDIIHELANRLADVRKNAPRKIDTDEKPTWKFVSLVQEAIYDSGGHVHSEYEKRVAQANSLRNEGAVALWDAARESLVARLQSPTAALPSDIFVVFSYEPDCVCGHALSRHSGESNGKASSCVDCGRAGLGCARFVALP